MNADEHPVMKRVHRPGDENRSIAILSLEDQDEWLHAKEIDAARTMLSLWPEDGMVAEAMTSTTR
ncbi:hypothetical protein [Burkholderia gladioli]|uniref:hypothetical protein n=1 Tax=Burkholderia gladioli TaxID=28095 RepID=UPI001640143A|nr:hypothetical protein [Burkholderia gladioli]